jgi:hypothetical protein
MYQISTEYIHSMERKIWENDACNFKGIIQSELGQA